MQWNPDVATQLIVASDEDSSPSLRVIKTLALGLTSGRNLCIKPDFVCDHCTGHLSSVMGYAEYNDSSERVCWAHQRYFIS